MALGFLIISSLGLKLALGFLIIFGFGFFNLRAPFLGFLILGFFNPSPKNPTPVIGQMKVVGKCVGISDLPGSNESYVSSLT